jgi:hypothetical protein
MYTLDAHESRLERNTMGPQGFRTLATKKQPAHAAPRRTPANLASRQAAHFLGAPCPPPGEVLSSQRPDGHLGPVQALGTGGEAFMFTSFAPNGSVLATTNSAKRGGKNILEVRLWDVASARELLLMPWPLDWPRGVTFSTDSREIACINDDQIEIWDVSMYTMAGSTKEGR